MPANNVLSSLYNDLTAIEKYLLDAGEASFATAVDGSFRKLLLLAVASYFEAEITTAVDEFVASYAGSSHPVTEIVRRKAIKRQYHTWFDWATRNANQFFVLFGEGFKVFMVAALDNDEALHAGVLAFLDLGNQRNLLVHGNFADFTINKTASEIFESYRTALVFVQAIRPKLEAYSMAIRGVPERES